MNEYEYSVYIRDGIVESVVREESGKTEIRSSGEWIPQEIDEMSGYEKVLVTDDAVPIWDDKEGVEFLDKSDFSGVLAN
jgi:hypothetical protein